MYGLIYYYYNIRKWFQSNNGRKKRVVHKEGNEDVDPNIVLYSNMDRVSFTEIKQCLTDLTKKKGKGIKDVKTSKPSTIRTQFLRLIGISIENFPKYIPNMNLYHYECKMSKLDNKQVYEELSKAIFYYLFDNTMMITLLENSTSRKVIDAYSMFGTNVVLQEVLEKVNTLNEVLVRSAVNQYREQVEKHDNYIKDDYIGGSCCGIDDDSAARSRKAYKLEASSSPSNSCITLSSVTDVSSIDEIEYNYAHPGTEFYNRHAR